MQGKLILFLSQKGKFRVVFVCLFVVVVLVVVVLRELLSRKLFTLFYGRDFPSRGGTLVCFRVKSTRNSFFLKLVGIKCATSSHVPDQTG